MRAYVKSAGRRAAQDYVWKAVESSGAEDRPDRCLLSIAEKRTANRGRVASFVAESGSPPSRFALFFGNVDSGRRDFYGTPILNRIAFVFDAGNGDDARLAQNLASDWFSVVSSLEELLASSVVAADDPDGFALDSSFAERLRTIAGAVPAGRQRPDADLSLFESISAMARLSSQDKNAEGHESAPASPALSAEQHPAARPAEPDEAIGNDGRPPAQRPPSSHTRLGIAMAALGVVFCFLVWRGCAIRTTDDASSSGNAPAAASTGSAPAALLAPSMDVHAPAIPFQIPEPQT